MLCSVLIFIVIMVVIGIRLVVLLEILTAVLHGNVSLAAMLPLPSVLVFANRDMVSTIRCEATRHCHQSASKNNATCKAAMSALLQREACAATTGGQQTLTMSNLALALSAEDPPCRYVATFGH